MYSSIINNKNYHLPNLNLTNLLSNNQPNKLINNQPKQYNKQSLSNNIYQTDTQLLKHKMKLLQQQLQQLHQLKTLHNITPINTQRSSIKSIKSSNNNKSITNNNQINQSIINHNQSNHIKSSLQQSQSNSLSLQQSFQSQNIKNNQINSLVTQLSINGQSNPKNKRSIKQSTPLTQRLSVQNLKSTIQLIDSSLPKRQKKYHPNKAQLKSNKHSVNSNIYNVTVAQIMAEELQRKQMIKQIQHLKDKLKTLETSKLENQQKQKLLSIEKQKQTNKQLLQNNTLRSQISGTGRIYTRSRIFTNRDLKNDSSQTRYQGFQSQRNSIQLKRNSNPFTWNPQVTLTQAQKPILKKPYRTRTARIYSSIQMQKQSQFNKQKKQLSKTKPMLQILKKKQIIHQIKKQNQPQQTKIQTKQQSKEQTKIQIKEQPTFINQVKQIEPIINQTKKQENTLNLKLIDQPIKSIEFLPELKFDKIKKYIQIPNDFINNFRQYISQKMFLINLPQQPSVHDSQSDLQSLGIVLFALFQIFVHQQIKKKGIQYKVIKYKNCVLFRLNQEKSIVWYYDGKFYLGGWDINLIGEGKKQGFGFQIIPNNYIYQGYFINNKREGYGVMFNQFRSQIQKNIIYQGFWKQGIKSGKGYQIQDNLEYLGDFQQGLQTGFCKIKTQHTFYEGQIKQSIKQGQGRQILKNGDQYKGMFKKNMFHGLGEYKWRSGAYFYGNFVEGKRKGQGIWISNLNAQKFDIYKGSYDENRKNGFGIYQWSNSTSYEGYFKNDLRHDQGLMRYPNGKAAKFIWKDGNKGTKIYCEEQESYRTHRNSTNKINVDSQNGQEENTNNLDFENNFLHQTLQQLNNNDTLLLYNKHKQLN